MFCGMFGKPPKMPGKPGKSGPVRQCLDLKFLLPSFTVAKLYRRHCHASVQAFCDAVLGAPAAGFFRSAVALQKYGQPWNTDDFGGFAVERAAISEVAKNNANNPIILAGDVHDGWGWKIYEGGIIGPGKPVTVNLVCPGVTSPGWGGFTYGTFKGSPVEKLLGTDGVYDMISNIFKLVNPGLVYGNVKDKGFIAVKMTPVSISGINPRRETT